MSQHCAPHWLPLEGKAFCDHHLLFVCSLVISVCCVRRKLPTASCLRLFILKSAEEQRAANLSWIRSLPGNFQTQSLEAIVTVGIPLFLGVCEEGELLSGPRTKLPRAVAGWSGWGGRGGPEVGGDLNIARGPAIANSACHPSGLARPPQGPGWAVLRLRHRHRHRASLSRDQPDL